MRTIRILSASMLAIVLCIGSVLGQEKRDSAKMAEMQKQWMELAQPGEEHKLLEKFEGVWDISSKWWMAPGADAITAEGTSENEMILGDRFLECEAHTEGGGMTSDVLTILGYDRRHNLYTAVSYDTWGTYYVTAGGHYDPKEKTLTLSGTEEDPVAGMTMIYDYVYHFSSKDTVTLEVIFKNPEMTGGQDQLKMAEVIYTNPRSDDLEENDNESNDDVDAHYDED